jgi:hypothetical protein
MLEKINGGGGRFESLTILLKQGYSLVDIIL